jgi:hypothetical protein
MSLLSKLPFTTCPFLLVFLSDSVFATTRLMQTHAYTQAGACARKRAVAQAQAYLLSNTHTRTHHVCACACWHAFLFACARAQSTKYTCRSHKRSYSLYGDMQRMSCAAHSYLPHASTAHATDEESPGCAGNYVYVSPKNGSNACPEGCTTIVTEAQCRSAATAVGKEYGGNVTQSAMPQGCYRATSVDKVYLNLDKSNIASGGAQLLCAFSSGPSLSWKPTP